MPKPKATALLTISMPRAIAEQVETTRKAEHRTRSELVREALRTYFARSDEEAHLVARIASLPRVRTTAAELHELRKGREEMKRGNYWTLDDFKRWLLADTYSQTRPKKSSTRAKTRTRKTTLRT